MKKILFICTLVLLPLLTFAQNDNPLDDDVYDDFKGITNVIRLDNNINVMQVNTSNNSFDLIAFDQNERAIWRTTIPGYGVNVGKFKNKIAVVAATEHTTMKGNGNTYKGFIIDPATGKTLFEKVIYNDDNDFVEQPVVMIGDNYFKVAVRQTGFSRSLHVGIPVLVIIQFLQWSAEMDETKKLDIIDLDDHLNVINTFHPIPSGRFIDINCNKNSDTFVAWLNGPDIEVYKYDAGKTEPSDKIDADVSIQPKNDVNLATLFFLVPSKKNPNDLYYSLMYRNNDRDPELMVGKMDFGTNTKKSVTQIFKKADLKALEKAFVPVNKKLDETDIGTPKDLSLKTICETDNGLVLALGGDYSVTSQNSSYMVGKALLLNAYDDDLNLKFTQIFPIEYAYPTSTLPVTLHPMKDKLYVVGNTTKGSEIVGVFGQLDMNSGQWDKMDFLIKKSIKGYLDAYNILWFDKGYIAPYMMGHGLFSIKYNLSLQRNDY